MPLYWESQGESPRTFVRSRHFRLARLQDWSSASGTLTDGSGRPRVLRSTLVLLGLVGHLRLSLPTVQSPTEGLLLTITLLQTLEECGL